MVSNGPPWRKEPPGAMLRYHGRLTTPSACPHIVRLSWLFLVSGGVRVALPHFSIELESGAAVSPVHNPAR